MACPEGLEPPTYCLEGNCSIRLSYGQLWCGWGGCTKGRHHTAPVACIGKSPELRYDVPRTRSDCGASEQTGI